MPKIYAVKTGRRPGVYHSWDEASAQVNGFAGAIHRSFKTMEEAHEYLGLPPPSHHGELVNRSGQGSNSGIKCLHGLPAAKFTASKPGPNRFRDFHKCAQSQPCKFFKWDSKRPRDNAEAPPGLEKSTSSSNPYAKRHHFVESSLRGSKSPCTIAIYTDGSCSGNRNVSTHACPAGWSAVVVASPSSSSTSSSSSSSSSPLASSSSCSTSFPVLSELFGPVVTPAVKATNPRLAPFFVGAEVGSNNTGELCGILEALLWLRDVYVPSLDQSRAGLAVGGGCALSGAPAALPLPTEVPVVEIRYDSEYACKVVTGEWQATKNATLVAAAQLALRECRDGSRGNDRGFGAGGGGDGVRATARVEVQFSHVKGHSGDPGNERADELAKRGARQEVCVAGRWAAYHQPLGASKDESSLRSEGSGCAGRQRSGVKEGDGALEDACDSWDQGARAASLAGGGFVDPPVVVVGDEDLTSGSGIANPSSQTESLRGTRVGNGGDDIAASLHGSAECPYVL